MSDGFRFSFGDEDEVASPSCNLGSSEGVKDSSAARESVTVVPWTNYAALPLDANRLTEWSALYPASEPQRQLCLELSCTAGNQLRLLYQCAPHVPSLELANENEAQGRPRNEGNKADRQDIIPGKYYGGLKVWSCALDLARFVWETCTSPEPRPVELANLSVESIRAADLVVEVGCGQGLPGILALLLGAKHVVFQDYNKEVLDVCVTPNIGANLVSTPTVGNGGDSSTAGARIQSVSLVSGDWDTFEYGSASCDGSRGQRFVFGSDVTFDENACQKLVGLLERSLTTPSDMALIATKDYYFGTNGGLLEFTKACQAAKCFSVSVVKQFADTTAMQRSVVLVRRLPSS